MVDELGERRSSAATQGGGRFVLLVAPGRTWTIEARSAETVRRELQKEMPGASYVTARPFAEIFAPNVRSWRLGATMFVVFGALALVLAAIGAQAGIATRTNRWNIRPPKPETGRILPSAAPPVPWPSAPGSSSPRSRRLFPGQCRTGDSYSGLASR